MNMDITKIMSVFGDTSVLQDLIKAENQIENEDGSLEFANDTTHLKLNVTDNGIQMTYSYEDVPEEPTLRDEFIEFCDTLDDDFFEEVCEAYTSVYGDGSLKKLNDTMDPELVLQFYSMIEDIAADNMATFASYRNNARKLINEL